MGLCKTFTPRYEDHAEILEALVAQRKRQCNDTEPKLVEKYDQLLRRQVNYLVWSWFYNRPLDNTIVTTVCNCFAFMINDEDPSKYIDEALSEYIGDQIELSNIFKAEYNTCRVHILVGIRHLIANDPSKLYNGCMLNWPEIRYSGDEPWEAGTPQDPNYSVNLATEESMLKVEQFDASTHKWSTKYEEGAPICAETNFQEMEWFVRHLENVQAFLAVRDALLDFEQDIIYAKLSGTA